MTDEAAVTEPVYPTVIKQISIPLDEHQVSEKAKAAGILNSDLADLEAELDGHKKRLKVDIDSKTAMIQDLLQEIHSGKETKTVECEVRKDFEANKVMYFFEGSQVDERDMTEDDRQPQLVASPTVEEAAPVEEDKHEHLTGGDASQDEAAV